jgi:hypothetical protein
VRSVKRSGIPMGKRTGRPHTWLRRFARLAGLLFLLLLAVSLPAGTQADATRTAQAVLHIRVNVVPVTQLPAVNQTIDRGSVAYSIPNGSPQMEVKTEIRPMSAQAAAGAKGVNNPVLETTTVVPR